MVERYRLLVVEQNVVNGDGIVMDVTFNSVEEVNHFEAELNTKWMNHAEEADAFGVAEENHLFKTKEDIDDEEPSYISTVEIIKDDSDVKCNRFIPDYGILSGFIIVDGFVNVAKMFNIAVISKDVTTEFQTKEGVKQLSVRLGHNWLATLPVDLNGVSIHDDESLIHVNHYRELLTLRGQIISLYNCKLKALERPYEL